MLRVVIRFDSIRFDSIQLATDGQAADWRL